jgi:hypothetical protein
MVRRTLPKKLLWGNHDVADQTTEKKFRVMVQFEVLKNCHSEARQYRARNLLFLCSPTADSSPINPASEGQSWGCPRSNYATAA